MESPPCDQAVRRSNFSTKEKDDNVSNVSFENVFVLIDIFAYQLMF